MSITHQQIADHAQSMIQMQFDAGVDVARRYLDQTSTLTWLCAFELVGERYAAIQNIAFALGSLDTPALQSDVARVADAALVQLDAMQIEMREFMKHNIHTA